MSRAFFISIFVLGASGLLIYAQTAEAVTPKKSASQAESIWVTTGAATRAHSDVQLRRLLSVFAEKESDMAKEELFEQIQKLRKTKR